jgi:hypothetical protein
VFKRLKNQPLVRRLADVITDAESQWFDASRHVKTSESALLRGLTLTDPEDGESMYIAVRVGSARAAFRALPIRNHGDYTFIDFGSGRGRVLFLAAEYPFRKVQGVEFALELHEDAERNIGLYRHRSRRCSVVESLHLNARDFRFPNENQVLFFFNPFAPAVMSEVLAHLAASLERNPREVYVMLVFPELAPLFAATSCLRIYQKARRYHIYQAVTGL